MGYVFFLEGNLFQIWDVLLPLLVKGKRSVFLFSVRWCKASLEGWMWTTQARTKQKHQKPSRFLKTVSFVPDLLPSLQFVFVEIVFGGFLP